MVLVTPYIVPLLPLLTFWSCFLAVTGCVRGAGDAGKGNGSGSGGVGDAGEGDAGGTGGRLTEVDSTGIADCGAGGTDVAEVAGSAYCGLFLSRFTQRLPSSLLISANATRDLTYGGLTIISLPERRFIFLSSTDAYLP